MSERWVREKEGEVSEEEVEGELIPRKTMECGHSLLACPSVCLVKWTTRERVKRVQGGEEQRNKRKKGTT